MSPPFLFFEGNMLARRRGGAEKEKQEGLPQGHRAHRGKKEEKADSPRGSARNDRVAAFGKPIARRPGSRGR